MVHSEALQDLTEKWIVLENNVAVLDLFLSTEICTPHKVYSKFTVDGDRRSSYIV